MSDDINKEVFISYNKQNFDLAQYLCNMLEGAGISCWIAPRDIDPGKAWAASIVEGLTGCNVMALLVSSTSLASQEVAKEVDLANTSKKDILPIRIEDVPLTGPLQYHLSTRQWVDAIKGEKLVRFQDAMAAILRMLNKSADSTVRDASVLGQARSLVAKLNQRHGKQLDFTNAMFSSRGNENDKVSIFYPLRIGATGVNLISEFDCNKKSIRVFGHRLRDGDPLKDPCGGLIERKYKETLLPKFEWAKHGRNIEFATLLAPTELTTSLLQESAETCFPRFANHVEKLSNTVLVDLLNWSTYAKEVVNALDKLEARLKELFPEGEGWRVGAPEGSRINGFLSGGKINVFKQSWAPIQDDYKERGLLAITLEAGGDFLKNLRIGVLKYEHWFELGEFSQHILDAGKVSLGNTVKKGSEWYPLEFSLADEWQDCGLITAESKWQGELDRFVDEVLECFKKFKELAPIIDTACAALPALQDKDPATIPETGKKDWWLSAHYIRNRLRLLTETVGKRDSSSRVKVDFQFKLHEWQCSAIFLAVKVGEFDAAISIGFNFHEIVIRVQSLEPPDFEAPIVIAFFAKHHPSLNLAGVPRTNAINQGLTLPEWIDKYESLVTERMDEYLTAMDHLARHLEQCSELSKIVARQLKSFLPESEGWVIDNHAAESLEPGAGIAIYRKTWLAPSHRENDAAPLLIKIVPSRPCFDELWLAISFNEQSTPELERAIGRIDGACELAFREQIAQGGEAPIKGIWARPMKAPLQQTGGSRFDTELVSETESETLSNYVQEVAQTIQQLDPFFSDACRIHNHLQFMAEFESLIDNLTEAIGTVYPNEQGWTVATDDVKSGKRYGKIYVYRNEWKRGDSVRGELSFAVEGDSTFFDNLYFGIVKLSPTVNISPDDLERVRAACDEHLNSNGKSSVWWASWRYADSRFRYPGGSKKQMLSGDELKKFIQYFTDIFKKLKLVAPIVDEILMVQSPAKQPADTVVPSPLPEAVK